MERLRVRNFLYREKSGDFDAFSNCFSAVQAFVANLYQEVHITLLGMELLDECPCSFDRAACREQVIVKENNVVWLDRVKVYFDGVCPIFQSLRSSVVQG